MSVDLACHRRRGSSPSHVDYFHISLGSRALSAEIS